MSIEKRYSLYKLEKLECISLNNKKIKNVPRELHFLQRLPELHQSCKYFVMISEEVRYMKSLKMLCLSRNKLKNLLDVSNAVLFFKAFFFSSWRIMSYENIWARYLFLKLLRKSWRCTLIIACWKVFEYSFKEAKDMENLIILPCVHIYPIKL